MADRQEWEQATAPSRQLAIAADAELRHRYPHQQIEPLRPAEPAPANDAKRLTSHHRSSETAAIPDLKTQQQALRTEIAKHRDPVLSKDTARGNPGQGFLTWRPLWSDAILQPPRQLITPSAQLLQLAAEYDIGLGAEAGD
ncbi:MAG TPA: hypothetical protein VFQ68_15335 [Streptosporangiaceae bacterium]|nr:hypothetical protein [Streptosporangiaceae bacterium]